MNKYSFMHSFMHNITHFSSYRLLPVESARNKYCFTKVKLSSIVEPFFEIACERFCKKLPVCGRNATLQSPQLRWPTIQKEAYDVFYCITHLEYLLRDRKFCLMTDHINLVYINKSVNMMV